MPRRLQRCLLVLVFVALAPSSATATDISLGFGSLPSSQGWTYEATAGSAGISEASVFSIDGTRLLQNTMGQIMDGELQYARYGVVNSCDPMVVTLRARVTEIEGDPSAPCYGYGFGISVRTGTHGYHIGFSPSAI